MSTRSTETAEHISSQEREQRVFRYLASYGQHPETERKYRPAIEACQSVLYLSQTVSEIARQYGIKPECLRNQLKRHFPEILSARNELRARLGCRESGNFGLRTGTAEKYAPAIVLLRDAGLTVREAATRAGVSYQGLQQHLLFHHKDIAESRMLARTDALLKPVEAGGVAACGGLRAPRPEAQALYAPAVELLRTTDLPLTEVARRCGVSAHNLSSYMQKWHREDLAQRRVVREAALAARRDAQAERADRSHTALARARYEPAIEMLHAGKSLAETAGALGVDPGKLSAWMKRNRPEVLEQARAGMMVAPSGARVLRTKYERYAPVAAYIAAHPAEPTASVACRFGVPVSTLVKTMARVFPEAWRRHKACLEIGGYE